jgi:hypothetical protein
MEAPGFNSGYCPPPKSVLEFLESRNMETIIGDRIINGIFLKENCDGGTWIQFWLLLSPKIRFWNFGGVGGGRALWMPHLYLPWQWFQLRS